MVKFVSRCWCLLAIVLLAPAVLAQAGLARDVVGFNGHNSYGQIEPWQPSGNFKVLAWFRNLNADADARTVLLSSASSHEFLAFSHHSVQGRWGGRYPGIFGKFEFQRSGFIELTVAQGRLSVSDGRQQHSKSDPAIRPASVSYDWIYRRGDQDFSQGGLQALVLLDLNNSDNSRAYGFVRGHGMIGINGGINGDIEDSTEDSAVGNAVGRLIGVAATDWQRSQRRLPNPAPAVFAAADWQRLFGTTDGAESALASASTSIAAGEQALRPKAIPASRPTLSASTATLNPAPQPLQSMPPLSASRSPLLGADGQALHFSGSGYAELSPWQSEGSIKLVAWLQRLPNSAETITTLLANDNGDYLGFSHQQVHGRWLGHEFRLGQLQLPQRRYLEITISAGQIRVSDGANHAELGLGLFDPTALSWQYLYFNGQTPSTGALQGLALIDGRNHRNSRNIAFANGKVLQRSADPQARVTLHHVSSSDWLPLNGNVAVPAAHIANQQQWDRWFAHNYPNQRPLLGVTDGNDGERFTWEGHYWLRAYVTMAQTYNDDRYLDYAVELADHIMANTDAMRVSRGELNLHAQPYNVAPKPYLNHGSLPVPGWRRPFRGWRSEVLTDGVILSGILRLVDHIKTAQKHDYLAAADRYLAQSVAIIRSHDSSYSTSKNPQISGSYHYVNFKNRVIGDRGLFTKPLPFNHSVSMATAMMLAHRWHDDSEDLQQKAAQLLRFLLANMELKSGGYCHWSYAFDPKGRAHEKIEDLNHGHLEVGFVLMAHQLGYGDLSPQLQCMANTLMQQVAQPPAMLSFGVDGSGVSNRFEQLALGYDWLELQPWDRRILPLTQHQLRHYGEPTWHRSFYIWARMLWWQQQGS
ncbi:hypothetical protein [uncultured Ferrimonas sp.]|uniref:hypothetical protein n=1 Tax=uncultured Ferrimonas sp. TaxID=432640 RepID=UPI002608BD98|nr:hypothetical protein [uncultured Ferrimonas sp.]